MLVLIEKRAESEFLLEKWFFESGLLYFSKKKRKLSTLIWFFCLQKLGIVETILDQITSEVLQKKHLDHVSKIFYKLSNSKFPAIIGLFLQEFNNCVETKDLFAPKLMENCLRCYYTHGRSLLISIINEIPSLFKLKIQDIQFFFHVAQEKSGNDASFDSFQIFLFQNLINFYPMNFNYSPFCSTLFHCYRHWTEWTENWWANPWKSGHLIWWWIYYCYVTYCCWFWQIIWSFPRSYKVFPIQVD